MKKRQLKDQSGENHVGVNPAYAAFKIAQALTTSIEHDESATRQRAKEKIVKWETVLKSIITGSIEYGSRTPVKNVPKWATLEVITGGFATGELLAGGPLQDHEKNLLIKFPFVQKDDERRFLNTYFLTDAGFEELQNWLVNGTYDVSIPEEGGLLVVAWLAQNGCSDAARELLEEISPYFPKLRFYPVPLESPRQFGSRVHLQDVGRTIENLHKINQNNRILAQKEATEVWNPIYDRIVALFLETVQEDWPCRIYPEGWQERALALLAQYSDLRKENTLCNKMERPGKHYGQLRAFLEICTRNPASLTGREVGRIRLILKGYLLKRGNPDSQTAIENRRRQVADVSSPLFHSIAGVVIPRIEKHAKSDGLDDISHLNMPVTLEEEARYKVPAGTQIPPTIIRKIERCLNESVDVLVKRGIISSGDTLAQVLPQMTSGLRSAGIADPALRQLYAAIYRAFRRRRSLLLFNLEKQVQLEELPWISVIERFRSEGISSKELARQSLEELAVITLRSFPYAIIPNKLLQEFRALAKSAELDIPLVDELAADIFMGKFSGKFIDSAKKAAILLDDSLYAKYYGINYKELQRIPSPFNIIKRKLFRLSPRVINDEFAEICAYRAGVSLGTWDAATNGMIIEQQQIITTQNLAALFVELNLSKVIMSKLDVMAKQCFVWICRRHQMKYDNWHSRLIMIKNTAYAWRQMIFFLSLLPGGKVSDFIHWADEHLNEQPKGYQDRFRPALNGLILATNGSSLDDKSVIPSDARRFLGWSQTKHWLLADLTTKGW